METEPDLEGCLCLACGAESLEVGIDAVVCAGCGERYDRFAGVPCLVRYQSDEMLSLIEILSNLGEPRTRPSAAVYEDWFSLLEAAHGGADPEALVAGRSPSIARHFPGRLRQYRILRDFLGDLDLAGRRVLDIGAGEGFDTYMLERLGAEVTAVEFNPLFCELGREATHARWIAASAHALPFRDEVFDVVVCQAALHHIGDIPAAMREALRVLRVGGLLLTVSDSYRRDSADEETVLRQFDRDPAVLRGVNEGVPRFSAFTAALSEQGEGLSARIRTTRVHGLAAGGRRTDILEPRDWRWPEDGPVLADTAGGVSFRIEKRASLALTRPSLGPPVARPCDFLSGDGDKAARMAALVRRLPPAARDLPFPGPVGNTKIELLNGWMARVEGEQHRRGYRRARRFLTCGPGDARAIAEVSSLRRPMTLRLVVNGTVLAEGAATPGAWTALSAPLPPGCAQGEALSVELHAADQASDFDDDVFLARSLALAPAAVRPAVARADDATDTPVAVIAFRRPETTAAVMAAVRAWRPRFLSIICDGPRDHDEAALCEKTRETVEAAIDWDCVIRRDYADANLGLRRRVETGLTSLFAAHDRAIILEDDCAPHPDFLPFCAALLKRYAHDPRVALIGGDNAQGYTPPDGASYSFSRFALIWGWAGWARAWRDYPDGVDLWPDARDSYFLHHVLRSRQAVDWWTGVLDRNHVNGNSWATVWLFANLLHGRLCAVPAVNMISNIGFGEAATHTTRSNPVRAAAEARGLDFPLVHPTAVAPDDEGDRLISKIVHARDPFIFEGGPGVVYDAIYADAMRRLARVAGLSTPAANHLIAIFMRASAAGTSLPRHHAAISLAAALAWRDGAGGEQAAARFDAEIDEARALLADPERLIAVAALRAASTPMAEAAR